jgi:hypothetical protein
MTEIWKEPGYAKPVSELRKMSDEYLEGQHDEAFVGGRPVGPDYYLDELARRAANRQADRIEKLTERIQWLTVVNVCAVLVSVGISVAVLLTS